MDIISAIRKFVHDIVDGLTGGATSKEISHVQHMVHDIDKITSRQSIEDDLDGIQGILHDIAQQSQSSEALLDLISAI
jgi:hypothetical protein